MPEAVPFFDPFALNFNVVPEELNLPARKKGVRGRDIKKQAHEWKDVHRVHEFDDGWYIGNLDHPEDIALLGSIQGHCSGTHFVWVCEERIWYFFALFDTDGNPRSTIHMKQASWIGKPHPRDNAERVPDPIQNVHGYGYPSLSEVKGCFQAAGLKYEAGKYRALHYDSQAYDFALERDREQGVNPFSYRYGKAIVQNRKPPNVDEKVWQAYVQAGKAVEDNYKQNSGEVQIIGRRVKFDGKWLILLSATNKSQENVEGTPGKRIAEWLAALNRKEKK